MRMPRMDQSPRVKPIILATGAAIVLLAAMYWGPGLLRSISGKERDEAEQKAAALKSMIANSPLPAAAWHREQHGRLSFDSPLVLKPDTQVITSVDQHILSIIERQEILLGGDDERDFHVMMIHVVCKPSTYPGLDGAVNRAMQGAAEALGDASPKYSVVPVLVDGIPARRASYTKQGIFPAFVEAVSVQDGQSLWEVHIASGRESLRADARRVIDSMKLAPADSPTTAP